MPLKTLPRTAAVLATLLSLGSCASITSSKSSADSGAGSVESLTSPFDSSSTSSGSGSVTVASKNYRRDVQSYTTAYLDDEAPQGEYLRGLADVAGLHGITNWEADEDTLGAIREVVQLGRLDGRQLERLRLEISPLGDAVVDSALGSDS